MFKNILYDLEQSFDGNIIKQIQTNIKKVYIFFWVIPWRLNFICQRFGTLCLVHLHRPTKMDQSVPKRRHIKFRRQGITQKEAYNIQNMAEI